MSFAAALSVVGVFLTGITCEEDLTSLSDELALFITVAPDSIFFDLMEIAPAILLDLTKLCYRLSEATTLAEFCRPYAC